MSRKLKIDLHTHPIEGLEKEAGIKSILDINQKTAGMIVNAVKKAGLDGIAITEHHNFNRGWVAALEIMKNFPDENLYIFPGEEVDDNGQQFLKIFVPDYIRNRIPFFKRKEWFFILAHPGYYHPFEPASFNDLGIDAVEEESRHGKFTIAEEISTARNIPLVQGSDAHRLEDIGFRYTEIDLLPR